MKPREYLAYALAIAISLSGGFGTEWLVGEPAKPIIRDGAYTWYTTGGYLGILAWSDPHYGKGMQLHREVITETIYGTNSSELTWRLRLDF